MSAFVLASWLIAVGEDPRVEAAWKIFWTIVVLIVIVIVTGGLIMFITRWTKQRNSAEQAYGDDRTSFKVLYERGELTEEEYQKIRARLGQKLKEKIKQEELNKAGAAKTSDAGTPETNNRLSTAEPEPTIRPAEEAKPAVQEATPDDVKPDDSDPSVKPA